MSAKRPLRSKIITALKGSAAPVEEKAAGMTPKERRAERNRRHRLKLREASLASQVSPQASRETSQAPKAKNTGKPSEKATGGKSAPEPPKAAPNAGAALAKPRGEGRPTKYQPTYCDEVVAFCRDGFSLTAFAGKIGVGRSTLGVWGQEHPEFLAALSQAKAAGALWWETVARKVAVVGGGPGSATIVAFALRNWSPDDYVDMSKRELSGPGGKPLPPSEPVTFVFNLIPQSKRIDSNGQIVDRLFSADGMPVIEAKALPAPVAEAIEVEMAKPEAGSADAMRAADRAALAAAEAVRAQGGSPEAATKAFQAAVVSGLRAPRHVEGGAR